MKSVKRLSPKDSQQILSILKTRFEKNINFHKNINWQEIEEKLIANPEKLWSLNQMEETGGEPDVISYDKANDKYSFSDFSPETPKDRRNYCYDQKALMDRKTFKPKDNAIDAATSMGIEILTEEEYKELQKLGEFDTKTSSWLKTPDTIRKLGGAIFADRRYNHVFIYHNGADSYYAARGFRGILRV
jgi:hypothetical protein